MIIPDGLLEELRDSIKSQQRILARKRRSIKSKVAPDEEEEEGEQFEMTGIEVSSIDSKGIVLTMSTDEPLKASARDQPDMLLV